MEKDKGNKIPITNKKKKNWFLTWCLTAVDADFIRFERSEEVRVVVRPVRENSRSVETLRPYLGDARVKNEWSTGWRDPRRGTYRVRDARPLCARAQQTGNRTTANPTDRTVTTDTHRVYAPPVIELLDAANQSGVCEFRARLTLKTCRRSLRSRVPERDALRRTFIAFYYIVLFSFFDFPQNSGTLVEILLVRRPFWDKRRRPGMSRTVCVFDSMGYCRATTVTIINNYVIASESRRIPMSAGFLRTALRILDRLKTTKSLPIYSYRTKNENHWNLLFDDRSSCIKTVLDLDKWKCIWIEIKGCLKEFIQTKVKDDQRKYLFRWK